MIGPRLILLAAALFGTGLQAQIDLGRAEGNYRAVLTGQRSLASLSPVELAEVATLDQDVRRSTTRPHLSARDRCRLANWPQGEAVTELNLAAIDLKCSQR